MKQCQYCGAAMLDEAVLCTTCGKFTPEFEKTYRGPLPPSASGTAAPYGAPTPNAPFTPRDPRTPPYAAYPPSAGAPAPTRGKPKADPGKTHAPLTMRPRRLLILVVAAIVGIGLLSALLGIVLPTETTEAYQEAMDEDLGDFESTVEEYVVAAYLGDEDAAREVFPEAFREDDLSEHGWEAFYNGAESYEITDVSRYHDQPLLLLGMELGEQIDAALDVEVAVSYSDGGEDETLRLILVRIEDAWYVYEVM